MKRDFDIRDSVNTPAIAPYAQQDAWREDLDGIYFLLDDPARDGWQQRSRLTAHIERLEAERDALLAEHEAWIAFVASGRTMDALTAFERAHDNAEGVMHSE